MRIVLELFIALAIPAGAVPLVLIRWCEVDAIPAHIAGVVALLIAARLSMARAED